MRYMNSRHMKADNVNVMDTGNNFTATNAERVFAEIDAHIKDVEGRIGNAGSETETDIHFKNVKKLGLVGDGKTNDLPALKQIIANANNGDIIYFPDGTYLLGNGDSSTTLLQLTDKDNITIRGKSRNNTILKQHTSTPAPGNKMGVFKLLRCTNTVIENLQIDGSSEGRFVANGGKNWGDGAENMSDTDCITVAGGKNIILRDLYLHHPIRDCIQIGRAGGGDVPPGEHAIIENCVLDYGYRQGVSIVGWNDCTIRHCRVSNTAMASDLAGTVTGTRAGFIGTSPMAGIDSETWNWNHNWRIENCVFENNWGGHINMNDGASEHIINSCKFIGQMGLSVRPTTWGVGSETPSAGIRTLNNVVTNCDFRNSSLGTLGGIFIIANNTFTWDDPTVTKGQVSLAASNLAIKRNGNSMFIGNRMSVRTDLYLDAGVDLSTLDIGFACAEKTGAIVTDNVFHNFTRTTPINLINSKNVIFTNNLISCDEDLDLSNKDIRFSVSGSTLMSNNIVTGKYPNAFKNAWSKNMHTNSHIKESNIYKTTSDLSLYKSRKQSYKICKFDTFNTIYAKVSILAKYINSTSNNYNSASKIEYDILAYKNGTKITQKAMFNSIFDNDDYYVTCYGFELIDGYVYLSLINELNVNADVSLKIEIEDVNNSIDFSEINLIEPCYKETIPTAYPVNAAAKTYTVGEKVRSAYAGNFVYKVTTGGTLSSTLSLVDNIVYTSNGVTFTPDGKYRTNEYGSNTNLACTRIVCPTALKFTDSTAKTIRVVPFPCNTTSSITYASSATGVATVNAQGLVTPKANGSAVITVTCNGKTATCNVTVSGL